MVSGGDARPGAALLSAVATFGVRGTGFLEWSGSRSLAGHSLTRKGGSLNTNPKIVAWMKPSCGWSNGVRAVFGKYGLEYEDKDIINIPENYYEMVVKTGQQFQPSMEIDGVILADISGEEVEEYLIAKGYVSGSDAATDVPIDAPCETHEEAINIAQPSAIQLGDISER